MTALHSVSLKILDVLMGENCDGLKILVVLKIWKCVGLDRLAVLIKG